MGFHVGRFVDQIDQNIICSICSAVLEEAVLTPCGHSFCSLCLDTWLLRPGTTTCPECRTPVALTHVRPVHAIRNLVNSLQVICDNKEKGCNTSVKVEALKTHLSNCDYTPIECAGCGLYVNRGDLGDHHINCEVIQSIVLEDGNTLSVSFESVLSQTNGGNESVDQLAIRVNGLENELKRIRRDLHLADHRNKILEKELRKARKSLEEKRQQLTDTQFVEFDPDYDYGYTSESILKLCSFLCKFLTKRPFYVDTGRVFAAVKRCYNNFGHSDNNQYREELHMLLATAYASNWFSRSQRVSLHSWIKSLIDNSCLSTFESCLRSSLESS